MYCRITSKLTKLVQHRENKKNFFKFNILLKKRVSTTKIRIRNLTSIRDLKIELFFNNVSLIFSLKNSGPIS